MRLKSVFFFTLILMKLRMEDKYLDKYLWIVHMLLRIIIQCNSFVNKFILKRENVRQLLIEIRVCAHVQDEAKELLRLSAY